MLIIDILCNCLLLNDTLNTLCSAGMKVLTSHFLCARHSAAASGAGAGAAVSAAAAAASCRSVQAWVLPPC